LDVVTPTLTDVSVVLLAEDDPAIADPLSRALHREGYAVHVVGDGPAALDAATAGGVDLLVLDLGLPGMDGLEVCRRLRQGGRSVPVLMLTARADEVDFVVGLDAGADDYVAKPFRLAELLARIRALLRRRAPGTVEVNGVRMDLAPVNGDAAGASCSWPTRSSSCCGCSCSTPARS
jgi:DNA-binding response OmpR family regulator